MGIVVVIIIILNDMGIEKTTWIMAAKNGIMEDIRRKKKTTKMFMINK